jgi:CRISPR-associated protein Cmr2
MSGDLIFRFSLGPVQGFIAQARRTRDLWAGSFLLSWLTAKAMVNVRDQMRLHDPDLKHYRILFPVVGDDPMIMALEKRGSEKPALATVPNQFKARVTEDFDAKAVGCAVKTAWQGLADEVYRQFVKRYANTKTERIWKEQIDGFWEITWVLGAETEKDDAGRWLAMRKNWRNHRQPDQGGEHCTLMGDWQEISGFDRTRNLKENQEFWETMRKGNELDLREGERLCAIALVKRFFPRLSPGALDRTIGWVPDGGSKEGIELQAWPSTGHIAATSWLNEAAKHKEVVDAAKAFASEVRKLSPRHFGEQHPRIAAVRTIVPAFGPTPNFAQLDSNFLRADDLGNERAFKLYDKNNPLIGEDDKKQRRSLLSLHRKLVKAMEDASNKRLGEPYPYYALLLMDGDNVGKLLDGVQDGKVSEALAAFTDQVKEAFNGKCDGLAIYAGGDDVVALTTVEDAIPAARHLAQTYRKAFDDKGINIGGKTPDISAAIVFADHHEPFRDVVALGHRLLKEEAKEANKKASLVVAVQKPSGPAATWVGKWRLDDGGEPPEIVAELGKARPFSGRFPYKIKARYVDPAGDRFGDIEFRPADIQRIFERELAKSREDDTTHRGTAAGKVDDRLPGKLATICRPPGSGTQVSQPTDFIQGLDVDGLLLVRFLDQYGIWP